ncbi:MAG: serine hydrolase domain-containing protein [Planctomycetota bacterium]
MEAIPRTQAAIERGIGEGRHPGAQVCVWREGSCVADEAYGEARDGVAMTPETPTLWLSSGKPVLAVAVARQVEAGAIDLDDPIAEYVPEFAERGKQEVTVRHVLTHTGGFRSVVFRYPQQTWDEAVAAVCACRLEAGWVVGETAGYHPHSGWNILGRVLEVVSGEAIGAHLRGAVLEPWGLTRTWVGMPEPVYDAIGDGLSVVLDTSSPHGPPKPAGMHERPWVTGQRPGGNAYGPASELARFYVGLLSGGELDGVRLLSPETVRDFTARHRRDTTDRTFRAVMDWGLGFMVNNARHDAANAEAHPAATPYGYGPHAGGDAFGHGGYRSSVGFADPTHGLAVAVVFNGTPGEPRHQRRMHETLAALYEDLGLD